ncbi:putative yybN protein [Listeria monocytogenes]|nr:putative yybN protein [Listeria monocytogenes]
MFLLYVPSQKEAIVPFPSVELSRRTFQGLFTEEVSLYLELDPELAQFCLSLKSKPMLLSAAFE